MNNINIYNAMPSHAKIKKKNNSKSKNQSFTR